MATSRTRFTQPATPSRLSPKRQLESRGPHGSSPAYQQAARPSPRLARRRPHHPRRPPPPRPHAPSQQQADAPSVAYVPEIRMGLSTYPPQFFCAASFLPITVYQQVINTVFHISGKILTYLLAPLAAACSTSSGRPTTTLFLPSKVKIRAESSTSFPPWGNPQSRQRRGRNQLGGYF